MSISTRIESTLIEGEAFLNSRKTTNVKKLWLQASHKPKESNFVVTIFHSGIYEMKFLTVKNWQPIEEKDSSKFDKSVAQFENFLKFLSKELSQFLN